MKKSIIAISVFLYVSFSCYAYAAITPPKWSVAVKVERDVLLTWELPKGAVKTIVYRKKK